MGFRVKNYRFSGALSSVESGCADSPKTYALSQRLSSALNPNMSLEQLLLEAANDLLPPPIDWITLVQYPGLFQEQSLSRLDTDPISNK